MTKASYIKLLEEGSLYEKVKEAQKHITNCKLCPHKCGVNRKNELGICRAGDKAVVSSFGPHLGEEDVLVGSRGSGTIFFAYCNMDCVYCQNYQTSCYGQGDLVSNEDLADIMLSLQDYYGCHNINLVTPSHFVANILEAVYLAAKKGLKLPLVYNCGGYESVATLKLLEGLVDIYLPDFKYASVEAGRRYSKIRDYPQRAKEALKEMDRQVGGLKTQGENIAYRGLLIRHLVLPGSLEDTKHILDYIKAELSRDVLVNLMDQYRPAHKALEYEEISRPLNYRDYKRARSYGEKLSLRLV